METSTIARINDTTIQVLSENGQKLVPVKPICEALGVDFEPQRKKLNEDEFLSSVTSLKAATGSDGKQYEMVCIPLKYVFGWLFTINPKNVKEEAREAVARYRAKCYDVLYDYFSKKSDFLEEKQLMVNQKIDELKQLRYDFRNAEKKMREAQNELTIAREYTYEEWLIKQSQTRIDFEKAEGNETYFKNNRL